MATTHFLAYLQVNHTSPTIGFKADGLRTLPADTHIDIAGYPFKLFRSSYEVSRDILYLHWIPVDVFSSATVDIEQAKKEGWVDLLDGLF